MSLEASLHPKRPNPKRGQKQRNVYRFAEALAAQLGASWRRDEAAHAIGLAASVGGAKQPDEREDNQQGGSHNPVFLVGRWWTPNIGQMEGGINGRP